MCKLGTHKVSVLDRPQNESVKSAPTEPLENAGSHAFPIAPRDVGVPDGPDKHEEQRGQIERPLPTYPRGDKASEASNGRKDQRDASQGGNGRVRNIVALGELGINSHKHGLGHASHGNHHQERPKADFFPPPGPILRAISTSSSRTLGLNIPEGRRGHHSAEAPAQRGRTCPVRTWWASLRQSMPRRAASSSRET